MVEPNCNVTRGKPVSEYVLWDRALWVSDRRVKRGSVGLQGRWHGAVGYRGPTTSGPPRLSGTSLPSLAWVGCPLTGSTSTLDQLDPPGRRVLPTLPLSLWRPKGSPSHSVTLCSPLLSTYLLDPHKCHPTTSISSSGNHLQSKFKRPGSRSSF
jgi:hypothetical protein